MVFSENIGGGGGNEFNIMKNRVSYSGVYCMEQSMSYFMLFLYCS